MFNALGAFLPGPTVGAGGTPANQPPTATTDATMAPAAGDGVAAMIALLNDPKRLQELFPAAQNATELDDATYWTSVARSVTTLP